jgi:hypothetical protein
VIHGGVVKVTSHVAQGCEVSISGEGRSEEAEAKRTRRPEWTVAGVHPLGDISYSPSVIQPHRARITAASANLGARSLAVSSLSWRSDLVNVSSEASSVVLTEHFTTRFALDFMW